MGISIGTGQVRLWMTETSVAAQLYNNIKPRDVQVIVKLVMAEDDEVLSLDERIENNLREIYENEIVPLKKIIDFVEQYKKFKLSGAEKLTELFKNKKEAEVKTEEVISTHGMPGFFAGDRDADTVMLMLNPGQDVALANNPITTYERIERGNKIGKGINISSRDALISTYKEDSKHYGDIDADRADNFDLKQAAFLKPWDNWNKNNVDFAGFLDDDYKKLGDNYKKLVEKYKNYKKLGNADKEEIDKIKKEIDEIEKKIDKINKKAKRNVLTEKLSLDLIPYASRKFEGVNSKQMELLFPYLETLFHEIFRTKRKYVIFCSAFYDNLFKRYNKYSKRENRKREIKTIVDKPLDDDTVFDQKKAYCTPIKIRQKDNGELQNAIIAHTFPNQSLPNAYERMEKYGRFCFKVWKDEFGEI